MYKTEKTHESIYLKNQTFFEKQQSSLEEIQTWSTGALKDCCQRHAYDISDTRLELFARVDYFYNSNVQE